MAGRILNHRFAINERRAKIEPAKRIPQGTEAMCPIKSLARHKMDVVAVDAGLQTIAVEFDLMHPRRTVRHAVDESGETRFDEVGSGAPFDRGLFVGALLRVFRVFTGARRCETPTISHRLRAA